MKENAFIGKLSQPTSKQLKQELGPTTELWNQLVTGLAEKYGVSEQEWTSYSPKAGWSMRLKRKKRVIVYLGPCHGCFRVAFVLGEKALKAAQQLKLPARIITNLEEAKRYPEGYAVRFEVSDGKDLNAIEELARVKIEN